MDVPQKVLYLCSNIWSLKTIYTVSAVDVVERSNFNMSFKYFLGMTPEEGVVNSSSLIKSRKLSLKDTDQSNLLINKTVFIAVEKDIIRFKFIIVDVSHTLVSSNSFSVIQVLRKRFKLLRRTVSLLNYQFKERML